MIVQLVENYIPDSIAHIFVEAETGRLLDPKVLFCLKKLVSNKKHNIQIDETPGLCFLNFSMIPKADAM